MPTHYLRNNTASPITIGGGFNIPANNRVGFYISEQDRYRYIEAIQSSLTADSNGLNMHLAVGDITYVVDTTTKTPTDFYSLWDALYNIYSTRKAASLYSSFSDIEAAAQQGTLGTQRYAFLMGGVVQRMPNGLWHGEVGSFDDPADLPGVTNLAVGTTATIMRTELCAEMWHIAGSNTGARYWKAEQSTFSPWSAAGKNLFVKADQTAGNIIDGVFIGDAGQQVAFADCYVSKPIPVTPGDLIACHASDSQLYPVSFYNSSMSWVATFNKSVWHDDTAGHYPVPAGAAYARLNVQRTYEDTTWFSIVSQTTINVTALATKKFVAMGDSVTNGVGTDSENIWWKLAAKAHGYKNLVNLGISGSLVTGLNEFSMSTRVASIDLDANAVSLMGGINDWVNNVQLGTLNDPSSMWQSTFYGALRYIAEYLRAHLPYAKVYWCTPQRFPTCVVQNSIGLTLEDYANAVLDVGREFGFVCADFFHGFMVDLAIAPFNWLFLSDTLHMNVAGNRLLASCFIDYLRMNHATVGAEPVIYRAFYDLTPTARDRVMIAGGGILRKINGLWLGDIGLFESPEGLPSTATLSAGATAKVGNESTGYEMWYVYGSNGTRVWKCHSSRYSVSSSLKTGNLFVLADQTAGNIIADGFIDTDGSFVSTTAFYVSKPIPVTPGDLIAIASASGVNIPFALYDSNMQWIATPGYNSVSKVTGHYQIPAGAAFARLNVSTYTPWYVFGVVDVNNETTSSKPKKITAIGDSISLGGERATDPDDIWWIMTAKEAGFETTVNLAVAGAPLSHIASLQIPQIPADTDVIQMLTGIPDYARGTVPLGTSSDRNGSNSFYGWLDYIADQLYTRFPMAKIIWFTPTPYQLGLNVNGYGNTLEDYAEAIRVVASRYAITLVDFYSGLGIDMISFRGCQLHTADGLHPNVIGNRLMTNMYLPYLRGTAGVTTRAEDTGLGRKQTIRHALGMSNIYSAADQTAGNIIDNAYINAAGQTVAAAGLFFVSSFYAVNAGSYLSAYCGLGIDMPIVFYDSSYNWISTANAAAARTNGHIQAPANTKYVRLNIAKGYEAYAQLFIVPDNTDIWFNKRVPRKYTAMGDSVTNGYSTNADNLWWRLSAKQAGYGTLVNMAVNDSTLAWINTNSVIYKVWHDEVPTDTDTLVIMGGIIDHSTNVTLGTQADDSSLFASTFYGSLQWLGDMLKTKLPLTKVIWCTPIRYNAAEVANGQGYTLADYAKAIAYVGKQHGFTVVDFYNDLSVRFNVNPYVQLFMDADGVHPNMAGNRVMSMFYTPYLESDGSLSVPYQALTTAKTAGSGSAAASDILLTNLSTASSAVVTATDSVLSGIGKLQAQVTAIDYTKQKATFLAGTTSAASLCIPPGVSPTTPVTGDIWNVSGVLKFYDGAATDTLAVLENAQTFTAQQTISIAASNALLLNAEYNNAFSQAMTCTNSILPTGGQFVFEFGTAGSNYNRAHFGFLNVGGAGSSSNCLTFGLYGANQLLKINGTGLATFAGKIVATASTTARASLNVASGTAPTTPVAGDIWNESGVPKFYTGSVTGSLTLLETAQTFTALKTFSAGLTVTNAKTTTAACVTGYASINLPHGTTPTTLADGDMWTTTSGVFARVNAGTVQFAHLSGTQTFSGTKTFSGAANAFTNTTDITVGTYTTGSLYASGGLSVAKTLQATQIVHRLQTLAVATAITCNCASGENVLIGASGVPGALTAATTITFSNPKIGSTTTLFFKQGTTSYAITFTISGYTFYQSGKTAGVASGSAVLAAADMTLSCNYRVDITWLSSTTASVALSKT